MRLYFNIDCVSNLAYGFLESTFVATFIPDSVINNAVFLRSERFNVGINVSVTICPPLLQQRWQIRLTYPGLHPKCYIRTLRPFHDNRNTLPPNNRNHRYNHSNVCNTRLARGTSHNQGLAIQKTQSKSTERTICLTSHLEPRISDYCYTERKSSLRQPVPVTRISGRFISLPNIQQQHYLNCWRC